MYEEFDSFDMSKLSWTGSFPRKLYVSYHPETGGSSWVGPIIVDYKPLDSDNDSISDEIENNLGLNPNSNDSDGDGISDGKEIGDINNPRNTDGTDEIDALDIDSDNDNISDKDEQLNGLDPLNATDAEADNDGDGYTNAEEIAQGTDIEDANSKPTPVSETRTVLITKGFGLYGINSSMTLAQLQEKIGLNNLISIDSENNSYKLSNVNEGLEFLNNFDKLEPFKAVWINILEDVSITYETFTEIEEQKITLHGGSWYLLNPPKEMSLELIKSQVGENNLDEVQGKVKTYKQENIDLGLSILNDFTGFEEPKGYWIKLKDDAVLTF